MITARLYIKKKERLFLMLILTEVADGMERVVLPMNPQLDGLLLRMQAPPIPVGTKELSFIFQGLDPVNNEGLYVLSPPGRE